MRSLISVDLVGGVNPPGHSAPYLVDAVGFLPSGTVILDLTENPVLVFKPVDGLGRRPGHVVGLRPARRFCQAVVPFAGILGKLWGRGHRRRCHRMLPCCANMYCREHGIGWTKIVPALSVSAAFLYALPDGLLITPPVLFRRSGVTGDSRAHLVDLPVRLEDAAERVFELDSVEDIEPGAVSDERLEVRVHRASRPRTPSLLSNDACADSSAATVSLLAGDLSSIMA